MSRINDALKRISESDKGASPPSPVPAAPAPTPSRKSSSPLIGLISAAIVLGVVGAAIFFRSTRSSVASLPDNVVTAPIPKAPEPAPRQTVAAVQIPTANPPAPQIAAPISNSSPPFPVVKLQAIFFTSAHPQALINGQTVGEGDSVAGALIKQIAPDSITAEWNGQAKIFHLKAP